MRLYPSLPYRARGNGQSGQSLSAGHTPWHLRMSYGSTVKVPVLVAVPPALVTVMCPAVAPVGTVAINEVADLTLNIAAVPLKATLVVPT